MIRVKVPAGVKLMPHRHPEDRIYTVISGVFYIGLGDEFDEDKMPGVSAGQRHRLAWKYVSLPLGEIRRICNAGHSPGSAGPGIPGSPQRSTSPGNRETIAPMVPEQLAVESRDYIVFIVDDDPRIRESLSELSRASIWGRSRSVQPRSILPIRSPTFLPAWFWTWGFRISTDSISKASSRRRIIRRSCSSPGTETFPLPFERSRPGAVDSLTKPFKEADLMRAINAALEQNREVRRKRAELADLHRRYSSLTPREREVLPLVASGLLNKQAAAELGISEITLQIHRGNVMKKMGAGSLAELVRMAARLRYR